MSFFSKKISDFVRFVELYRVPFQNLLHRLERLGNFCNIKI